MQEIGWIFAKGEARATRYYARTAENEALRDSVNETTEATPKKDRDIATYKRSAQLYADFQSAPDLPALFRWKYQDRIRKLVARIVTGSFAAEEAAVLINEKSLDIKEQDRIKFIEYVNTQLLCLHEGNIA